MTELSRLKISEARDRLAAGEITSLDLTEACLAEIETAGDLNAFVHRTPQIAVEQAKRADARIAAGAKQQLALRISECREVLL